MRSNAASCCRCGAPLIKKKKADRLVCLVWYWVGESNSYYKIENLGY